MCVSAFMNFKYVDRICRVRMICCAAEFMFCFVEYKYFKIIKVATPGGAGGSHKEMERP